MVPDFRRDDVWIPVFTGMTDKDGAFFKALKCYKNGILEYWNHDLCTTTLITAKAVIPAPYQAPRVKHGAG
jgi:hypothetical protein